MIWILDSLFGTKSLSIVESYLQALLAEEALLLHEHILGDLNPVGYEHIVRSQDLSTIKLDGGVSIEAFEH